MRKIRILIYYGTEDWVNQVFYKSLDDGCHIYPDGKIDIKTLNEEEAVKVNEQFLDGAYPAEVSHVS